MISIIVPIFNAATTLHNCVDSILNQEYIDFELLLIDDGSSDNSGSICDEYAVKDSRVRVFHKKNGGVSSARNLGLHNAIGEWVTFCDADDYVGKGWLSAYGEAMDNDADLAIQGMYHIGKTKTLSKSLSNEIGTTIDEKKDLILRLSKQCVFGYVGVKLFRRDIIYNYDVYFDEKSAVWEDGQFIAKYLEYTNSFYCFDYIGYFYYLPPENKAYNGDCAHAVYYMLKSFDNIFSKEIPYEILAPWYSMFKDYIVTNIVKGYKLDYESFELYDRVAQIMGENKIISYLINRSQTNRLALVILKMLRRLLVFKETIFTR